MDILGRRFGLLEVVGYAGFVKANPDNKDKHKQHYWYCLCDCGRLCIKKEKLLLSKRSRSCGCLLKIIKHMHIKNMSGKQFGRLVVGNISHKDKRGNWHWNCKCECGNLCIINGASLRSGFTQSCGCYKKDAQYSTFLQHGVANTKLAAVRTHMLQRCYNIKNKSYHNYGGRGITVCEAWRTNPISFYDWAFSSGYKVGLSLDRINNDGNYEPDNCRWVGRKEQSNNTRANHYITYKGETKTIANWTEELQFSNGLISSRLLKGWTEEEALTLPLNTKIKAWRKKNGKKI
jgi:hypothetical protein